MTKRYQVLAGILALFLVSVAGSAVYFVYNSPINADEPRITRQLTTLSLDPGSAAVALGESGKIDIKLANGAGAQLVRFHLIFSPGIKIDKFIPSLVLPARPEVTIDNENGLVAFEGRVRSTESSFSLGSLSFTATSTGTVSLDFDQDFNPPSAIISGETRLPALQGAAITVK